MSSASERLRELVKEKLALDMSRRQDDWFEGLLQELASAETEKDVPALLDRLYEEGLSGAAWSALVDRLTIAETYFFRDAGQMELLRDHLLPQLMREAQGRRLRVWSAGCSTGEELYSVAMLLDSLGNPPADLLGTDVNPAVVEQARRGIYRQRSLRSLPARLRAAYLQPHGREFRINDQLRQRTSFSVENLFHEQNAQLRGLDLIICRNVLIYFERERLPGILERFYKALRPGGLLLTGHGETLTVQNPFATLAFPASLVYQRPDVPGRRPFRSPSLPISPSALSPASFEPPTAPPFEAEAPAALEVQGERPVPELDCDSLCRQARQARLQGRQIRAQKLLWQALYLAPDWAHAYLELGLLAAGLDLEKARKHHSTALALLGDGIPEGPLAESLRELERVLS